MSEKFEIDLRKQNFAFSQNRYIGQLSSHRPAASTRVNCETKAVSFLWIWRFFCDCIFGIKKINRNLKDILNETTNSKFDVSSPLSPSGRPFYHMKYSLESSRFLIVYIFFPKNQSKYFRLILNFYIPLTHFLHMQAT